MGVSISTLRGWDLNGELEPDFLTPGRHRRYSIDSLKHFAGEPAEENYLSRKTVLYSRVSSSDQRDDLKRQTNRLQEFASQQGFKDLVTIEDLGSGLNFRKPGLSKLIKLLLSHQVERLIINYKDRLLRFGSELLFKICQNIGTEVIILEKSLDQDFEQELAADIIEIITVFTSRLYGRRSHLNRKKAA